MLGYESQLVRIESAVITQVYPSKFLVDALTTKNGRVLKNIPYATAMSGGGYGINFMPKRGSLCWVMLASSDPSNTNVQISPSIIGFQTAQSDGSYQDGRVGMNESDIVMNTPGGATVLLRANGLVEISGGALARTMYMPLTNTIFSLCQNYQMTTPTGEFYWNTGSDEDSDGTSSVAFALKELGEDTSAFLKITAGESSGGLEVLLLKDGQESSAETGDDGLPTGLACRWRITKDGRFEMRAASRMLLAATETLDVESAVVTVFAQNAISLVCGSSRIDVLPEGITITTPSLGLVATSITGSTPGGAELLLLAENSPRVVTEAILPFLKTHTHNITAPVAGEITSPPTQAGSIVESLLTTKSRGIV
jgi:hypothetical protein